MRFTIVIAAMIIAVGLAGWATAEEKAGDLEMRVIALEQRIGESQVLKVRGLVVQDAKGRDRLVIDTPSEDAVRLEIRGPEGEVRACLEVDGHQAVRFVLLDRQEKHRLAMQLLHGDAPYIGLWGGPNREKQMRIEAPIEGAVGFGMWGGPGKLNETSHAGFWIWENGTIAWGGGLRSAGRTGFHLKYRPDGSASFDVRDAEEAVLWRLPQGK